MTKVGRRVWHRKMLTASNEGKRAGDLAEAGSFGPVKSLRESRLEKRYANPEGTALNGPWQKGLMGKGSVLVQQRSSKIMRTDEHGMEP